MNNRDLDFHPAAPRFPFPCADDGAHAIRLRLPVPVRHGGKEALLIDLALADRHVLADGAPFGMEVTGFGGRHDGLAQLARWAALGDGYDALHLLCHGAAGRLMLGARTLDRAALADPHVADALAAIGQAVRPGGAVLLYACRAAQGEEGAAFVAALAQALGVPVAASSMLVGAAAQGGSWALDHVAGIPVAGIPVAGIPAAGDPVAGIGAAHALSATALAWPDYAHTLTVAQNTTTFAHVPFEANENYAQAAIGYPTPTILSAANVATSGWDVTAQSSVNTGTFLIRGIGFNDNTGDGDGNSLRVQAADIDYVIFKSNANGFYFDLNNFAVVNNTTTPITVQAIDRAGNPVGAAVAFTVAGSEPAPKAYTHASLAGNPDFVGIYGFKVTFDSASDAPFFDNLVIDNIGFPAVPTTTILDAALSADSGASAGDFVTNIAAQTIGGTLSAALLAGESVQVSYDGGATWNDATGFTAGSSAWSTGTTLAGSGTFMARVTNGDGAGPAFSQAYVLDTDAPAAPSTPNLNSSSDTGFSGSDDITANTTPVVSGSAEDGSTVTLVDSDGSTVLGTATASGGAWSITASSLADGVHHLSAKAVDLAGNVSVASAALALTVDTAAPVGLEVSTAAVGTGDAGSGAAIATLSASDSTALKYLMVAGDGSNDADNASFAIAGNTLKVGGAALAAGTYHIHLAAVDAAGNVGYLAQDITVSASPTVGSIVRAGGAGAAVAASAASAEYTVTFSESVSGVDIGDFTLTGTGSAAGAIASVSGSGDTYVVTVDGLAGDGTLRLDLKAGATGIQNAAGTALGSGGYTAGATYTLDHTAPAAPAAPSLDSGSDSGASSSDGITNHTTPQISGSAEDGSAVTLYDSDGSTVLGTTTASGGAWSIVASALAQGSHHLTVKALDAAGNLSAASSALALTIDTAAPAGLALSAASAASLACFGGAALATLSAGDSTAVTYALATGNGSNDADNATFSVAGDTLSVGSLALSAGTYHIYLSATDAAGNVSYLAQAFTVVDAPVASAIVRSGGAGAAVAAAAGSVEYTVHFSEAVSGVDAGDFSLSATGSASGAIASVSGGGDTWTVTVDGLSGDGTLRLDLKADGTGIQNAGGIGIAGGYAAGATYTLDHTAPAAPAAPGLDAGADSGASASDGITNHAAPVVRGSAEDGSTVTLVDSDGATVLGTAIATGGAWSIASSTLADGEHSLTVKAVDKAGNASPASAALAVTIDTAAPAGLAVGSTAAATAACVSGAALATLSAIDSTAVTYALAAGNGIDDADNAAFVIAGNTLKVGAAALAAGTFHIYLAATDAAGNVSYLAQAITVADAPAVASIVRADGAGAGVRASATSVDYTVTFSEDVSGVDAGDFTLDGSGSAGGAIGAVTGSGKVYTVTVDGLAGDGSLRLDLKADGTGIVNTHGIAIAGGYALGAGYVLDHTAPAAPSAVALDARDDSGVSSGDGITSVATPRISGIAEPDALVRLYDSDGVTRLGKAIAGEDGHWTITSDVLAAGSHSLTVRQFDAAGNASGASAALQVEIRTAAATLGAPLLDAASDSGIQGDGLTRIATPAVSGMAGPGAVVTLYDSDGVTVLGSASANPNGVWRIVSSALADGVHTLSARQTDVAGNVSPAGAALSLNIDTAAPAAPSVPALAAGSGAGVTAGERPLITGSALPDARVTLYDSDGSSVLGTATADAGGHWQITSPALAVGKHLLTARQSDAAGNVSDASTALALAVAAPAAPAPATTTIDGVQVTQQPVVLPGGGDGIRTIVPIVGADRSESAGGAATADIPLVSAGGDTLLLAQAGVGFGLSVSGGPSRLAGNAVEQLIQSIKASTPDHPAADQGHLTGNAQGFLNTLAKQATLLVQTVTPVTAKDAANATLTLTGTSDATQHTALVIDAGGVGAGNTLVLKAVDFAAVIGAATVVGETAGQILTGDAASQTFVADSGLASLLFAGGGDDTLHLGTNAPSPSAQAHAAMAAAAPTLLHGGAGADTAVFAGARSAYTIDYHEGHVLVTANTGAHDQARVVNVETLQFQDGSVAVQDRAPLAAIAGLYADVLGRQADVGGFDFWGTAQKNGASLGSIALSMIGSSEGQAHLQAFDGDAAHDVGILYQAVFNRTADAGGLAFWTEAVRHGATLEQVADQFMHSAEIVGHGIKATGWDFLV